MVLRERRGNRYETCGEKNQAVKIETTVEYEREVQKKKELVGEENGDWPWGKKEH